MKQARNTNTQTMVDYEEDDDETIASSALDDTEDEDDADGDGGDWERDIIHIISHRVPNFLPDGSLNPGRNKRMQKTIGDKTEEAEVGRSADKKGEEEDEQEQDKEEHIGAAMLWLNKES